MFRNPNVTEHDVEDLDDEVKSGKYESLTSIL